MTSSTAKESLKIKNAEKAKNVAVKPKDKWTDDLSTDKVEVVNQSIASINQTQFNSIVQTANELCKIKETIDAILNPYNSLKIIPMWGPESKVLL